MCYYVDGLLCSANTTTPCRNNARCFDAEGRACVCSSTYYGGHYCEIGQEILNVSYLVLASNTSKQINHLYLFKISCQLEQLPTFLLRRYLYAHDSMFGYPCRHKAPQVYHSLVRKRLRAILFLSDS